MKVSKLMSKRIVSVGMNDTVAQIKDIFLHTKFHHILVIDDNELSGIISDRDLFKSLNPAIDTITATHKDLACLSKKAHQIMGREPITLEPEATVGTAIKLFNKHGFTCIPIVSDSGQPVGILSWRDVMRALRNIP